MAIIGEVLFYRSDHADVGDLARHHDSQLSKLVEQYDQRRFDAETDDQVVNAIAAETRIDFLQVDFEEGEKKVEERSVAVRDMFSRGAVNVAGYRVTKSFPFTGDRGLWTFGAGQWSSSMPYGQVGSRAITVGMDVRESETDKAVAHIKSTVTEIQQYLALQQTAAETFNSSLAGKLLPLVQARRARRNKASDLLDRF